VVENGVGLGLYLNPGRLINKCVQCDAPIH
jgi:hypothetical protein